jgi:hypothetical protein
MVSPSGQDGRAAQVGTVCGGDLFPEKLIPFEDDRQKRKCNSNIKTVVVMRALVVPRSQGRDLGHLQTSVIRQYAKG